MHESAPGPVVVAIHRNDAINYRKIDGRSGVIVRVLTRTQSQPATPYKTHHCCFTIRTVDAFVLASRNVRNISSVSNLVM